MKEINENPSELNGSQVQNQQISDYLTKSIKELMSLAKDDDPEAMFELGHRYRIGDGCKIDMGISDDWFEKAVECGYDYKSYYSKGLPEERYDSLLRLIKNYEDDCYWGIQEFEDPQDAWKVMNGSWISDESGVDINLCVLDDEEFENMIFCRAVVALCEEHFGKITHEECMLRLGKNGISDYLVDLNFFHYSKKMKLYFTSRMSFKEDRCNIWSSRQWCTFELLRLAHSFDGIVGDAEVYFMKKLPEIENYGYDNYKEFLMSENLQYV